MIDLATYDGGLVWIIGLALIWIAALLTLLTGWDYFRKALPISERTMKREILYFAWLRERVGLPRETVETDAETVAELVSNLQHAKTATRWPLPTLARCASRSTRN